MDCMSEWGTFDQACETFGVPPTKHAYTAVSMLVDLGLIARRDHTGRGAASVNLSDCRAVEYRMRTGRRVPLLDVSAVESQVRAALGYPNQREGVA